MKDFDSYILKFIKKVRRRFREVLIVKDAVYALLIGFFLANMTGMVSLLLPFYYAVPVGMACIGMLLLFGILLAIIKTPDLKTSALLADKKELRERVITAYGLRGKNDAFSMLQKRDTVRVIEKYPTRRLFPLHVNKKATALLFIFCCTFVVISFFPTPSKEQAKSEHEITKVAKEDIKKVKEVLKTIDKLPDISEQDKAEIEKMLNTAEKELKEAKTEADLKKAEERLFKKLEMASEKTENEKLVEALLDEIEALTGENQDNFAKEFEETKEALEQADGAKELEKESSKEAAEQAMEKLAKELGNEELTQAASALKNSQGTSQDIADAKKALEKAKNQDYASNGNQNSNGEEEKQDGSGQNGDGQDGSGQSGDGQDGSGQSGNGQDGSGQSGNGQSQGTGSGWNKGSRKGKEGATKSPREMIAVPGAKVGNDDDLTGKQNDLPPYMQKSDQSMTWAGNQIDYNQVKGEYSKRAYSKLEGNYYPNAVKDKIRLYFERLNQ